MHQRVAEFLCRIRSPRILLHRVLLLRVLLLCGTSSLHAQAVGRIRGMVYDSVWSRPLASAPDIFLDGRQSSTDEITFFLAEDVYGIEIYSRAQTVPAQFVTGNTCGAILVWTKRGRS